MRFGLCQNVLMNLLAVTSLDQFILSPSEYRVDPADLHLSGLEAFSFDYMVKWPVSLVINRRVRYV